MTSFQYGENEAGSDSRVVESVTEFYLHRLNDIQSIKPNFYNQVVRPFSWWWVYDYVYTHVPHTCMYIQRMEDINCYVYWSG